MKLALRLCALVMVAALALALVAADAPRDVNDRDPARLRPAPHSDLELDTPNRMALSTRSTRIVKASHDDDEDGGGDEEDSDDEDEDEDDKHKYRRGGRSNRGGGKFDDTVHQDCAPLTQSTLCPAWAARRVQIPTDQLRGFLPLFSGRANGSGVISSAVIDPIARRVGMPLTPIVSSAEQDAVFQNVYVTHRNELFESVLGCSLAGSAALQNWIPFMCGWLFNSAMPQNACNHQNTLPTSLCPPDAIALRASLTTAIISGKCISSSTRRPVFPSAGLLQRYLSLVDPGLFDSVSRNGGACIRASENEIGRHTCGWDTEAAACANGCRADGLVCTGGPPLPPPPPAPPSAPAPPTLPVPPSPSGSPLPSTTLDPSFTTPDPIPTSTTASGPPTLPTTAENPPQSTVQPGPSPTGQTLPPLTSVDPSSGTGTGNGGMVQDQSAAGSSGLRSGTAVGLSIGGGVAVLAIAVAVAGYASHRRQARSRAMEQHHLHGPQQLSGGTTLSTAVGTAVGSEPLGGGSGGGSLTDLARRLSNGAGTGGRRVPSSSGLRPVAFAPNPFLSVSSSKDAGGSASAVAAPPLVDTRANGASRFNSDRRTPAASASSRSAQPWPERHSLTVSHYPSLPRQQQQQSSGDDRGSLSSGKSSGHDISPILARLPPVPPEIEDDGSAIQRVLVEVEFEPTLDDELGLVPGDRVRVIQAFQDGWAAGMLEGTDRYGVFPLACSTPIVDE